MARGRGFTRGYSGGQLGRNIGGASNRRPPLTHFLCIPLVTESSRPELENSLLRFKQIIADLDNASSTQSPTPSSIPPTAIRPVDTLHLTLGVMSLQESHRVEEAVDLLKNLDIRELLISSSTNEAETPHTELKLSLLSLLPMNTPTNTSILYAKPDDSSNRLQSFAEKLQSKFQDAGFIVDEKRPLKLHATVLNMIYTKSGIGKGKSRIDATQLLEECKDFIWAKEFRLEEVAICKMGAKKEYDQNGELLSEKYESIHSIDLPI
jgi:activating signal cointegrator complex subunit 1